MLPRYHPKIIRHILTNVQKNKCVYFHEDYTINHNENGNENDKQIT